MALEKVERKNYVSILGSDATLRIVVPAGTSNSVTRNYELKDGTKGSKNELVFNKITGMITGLGFQDGNYGKMIQVEITDAGEPLTLSIDTAQNFGEDFMKKLPSIDLSKVVTIAPYSFEDDKGKTRKGLTITQEDKKIPSFFYDADNKKNINGYPDPTGDTKTYSKDLWKIYFMQARMFLVKYTEDNILPKVKAVKSAADVEFENVGKSDEIDPDKIPL